MKKRTREENAAYSRMLRAKRRVAPVAPTTVSPSSTVAPVAPCQGCSDRDMANKILRAKLLASERQVELLKRDIPKKPDSPYKFGPERSLNG